MIDLKIGDIVELLSNGQLITEVEVKKIKDGFLGVKYLVSYTTAHRDGKVLLYTTRNYKWVRRSKILP